jgi:excinuclease ABC subunit C
MRHSWPSQQIVLDKKNIKKLPAANGVYMFVYKREVLYVGKSVNLKARLLSHLESAKTDRKEAKIITNSERIKYFLTDSEFKALILEAELIRTYHPKYNIRWKDDKSYLYIKITKNDYPKIFIVRKEKDPKAFLFGPFPSVRSVQNLLRQIRKQPCFYSQIGLCSPCPNYIENLPDSEAKTTLRKIYRRNISHIIKILHGNLENIEKYFQQELKKLTKQEKYEDALKLRNRFFEFRKLITQRLFDIDESSAYDMTLVIFRKKKPLAQWLS